MMSSSRRVVDHDGLSFVPANEATWDDLQAILTGSARRCQCERQRLGDGDWWHMPPEQRADLFRAESRDADDVWAIACLIVRPRHRGRGLTYPLVSAAVAHAKARGARVIEGYPMLTGGANVSWGEMNVGAVGPFLAAGFTEVSRPTVRRVVMRLEL